MRKRNKVVSLLLAGCMAAGLLADNDPFIASDNEPSDSNHGITLKEAKFNFSKFGACEKEMLCYVRSPRDDEKEIS